MGMMTLTLRQRSNKNAVIEKTTSHEAIDVQGGSPRITGPFRETPRKGFKRPYAAFVTRGQEWSGAPVISSGRCL